MKGLGRAHKKVPTQHAHALYALPFVRFSPQHREDAGGEEATERVNMRTEAHGTDD